jgi:hypothetical protein
VPEGIDELAFVKAEEVKYLRFSYFDGTAWQDFWDGSQVGSDGYTPIGPPVAIGIELGVIRPGVALDEPLDAANLLLYRHVVSIPTANGTTPQQQDTTTTAP